MRRPWPTPAWANSLRTHVPDWRPAAWPATVRHRIRQRGPRILRDRAALIGFGDCTGAEFMAVAENVGDLDRRLAEIGAEVSHLQATVRDHDDDRALSSAFDLFKKSIDLAHSSIGIALSQEEQMEQMEALLLQNRERFSKNNLMFRLLVMNIRMEAERVQPEVRTKFIAVAAEMDVMERRMTESIEAAFTQLETIVKEAATGRVRLQSLQHDLHGRAQGSIQLLRAELDVIKSRLVPCVQASDTIGGLLKDASRHTADLITSLQYQDIVRQQLDHICEGFGDISTYVQPEGGSRALDLSYLHQAAHVQLTHLRSSRHSIAEAGGKIAASSHALLETGITLVERFAEMSQIAGAVFQESKIRDCFQQETDSLVQIAGQSETSNDNISRLLERIEQSVTVFATEIAHHELQVQIVGLNAQIAAAQVPDAWALNKLAEETARISEHNASLTRAMTGQLHDTVEKLRAMQRQAQEVRRVIGTEKADLASGSSNVTAKLERLKARIGESTRIAASHFATAYEKVSQVLQDLSFPSLIPASFDPAEEVCLELCQVTAPFAGRPLSADAADRLRVHRGRYTMQGEHAADQTAVHLVSAGQNGLETGGQRGLAPESVDGHVSATTASPEPSMALGEGVELF